MKNMKTFFLLLISLSTTCSMLAQKAVKDTALLFNQKRIYLTDSADQVKVKVYKTDTTEYKQIYEGIYTDEKSFEQYSVASQFNFDYLFSKRKKSTKMSGHFVGVGAGALYTTNNFTNFNDAGGMKVTFSNEISWNPIGYTLPVIKEYLGLTTGLGMTWRNLHLGDNNHLINTNNVTSVAPAPEGISYYYSRLRMFDLNVPVYLEIHPEAKYDFYLMGGVLFGINTFTSYKVKYKDVNDKKVKVAEGKDYNVNPFSLNYVIQMGWDDIGVYAKYTPTSLFKKDKGPNVQTFSAGLILTF